MFELEKSQTGNLACIKVIGVGGGGGNAVNRMIAANVKVLNLLLQIQMLKPWSFPKRRQKFSWVEN